jgi:leader peptidase (prepilin peptidase)/N-methyltransferase
LARGKDRRLTGQVGRRAFDPAAPLFMDHIAALIVAPFVGSFLSLLVVRLPVDEPIVFGRSRCRSCHSALSPIDLVPLLSWLWRRGRCRHCSRSIPVFYPAIELAAMAVAVWAAFLFDGGLFWATCILGWTLLALAATDTRDLLLPDGLTLPLLAVGLGIAAIHDWSQLPAHLAGAAIGFAALYGINLLYRRLRGRDGLGLGDAKLLAAAGAWLGWAGLPSVLLISGVAALAGVAIARAAGRKIGAADPIPFGAFLSLGFWLVWLYGPLAM